MAQIKLKLAILFSYKALQQTFTIWIWQIIWIQIYNKLYFIKKNYLNAHACIYITLKHGNLYLFTKVYYVIIPQTSSI